MRRAAILCVALAGLGATSFAAAADRPHLVRAEFYEDLEDGPRNNVAAVVKGEADRVSARSGSFRTNGRLSGHVSGPGNSKVWFFREHQFVKRVKADLYADGFAQLTIKVIDEETDGDAGAVSILKKVCDLRLEPDAQFGDYASGDCDKA